VIEAKSMQEPTIYALKVDEENAARVFASLKEGEARFGWSYVETANLLDLQKRLQKNGWDSLSEKERDCCQEFLLAVRPDDYVVYINVPAWGQCTLAQVTKPYYWKWNDDDFNHRLRVDPTSVKTFDRNDPFVHPSLSARLKLQGRWWRIYATKEFEELLAILRGEPPVGPLSASTRNLGFLSRDIRPLLLQITELIHRTHPNYSLEGLMAEVLKGLPAVKEVRLQGGAGDRGADILVTVEQGHPLTGDVKQTMCVVQVKSFEGEHWDTQAVEDIRRAFQAYPDAEAGLIVSTASKSGPTLETALDKLKVATGKHVSLLIGEDVALFVLRYGPHLISTGSPNRAA
jgi:hypothetical protein